MMAKPAERIVGRWLWTLEGVENVEPFPFGKKDVDFRVTRWGQTYYADVEARGNTGWKHGAFPYSTVHVPARKEKMISRRTPFIYLVVRADLKKVFDLPGEAILSSPKIIHKNKFMPDGDTMFDVSRINITGYYDL